MPVLSDPIFAGKCDPNVETLKMWTITGGSEQVEQKLKDGGWNGVDITVSVGLHLDSEGKITDSQLFVSGFMTVGKLQAPTIFGDSFK